MKSKPVKIHEFDPVIYPVKFWVISEMDKDIIKSSFKLSNGSELDLTDSEGGVCYTYYELVVNKKSSDYGFMVVMKRKDRLSVGGIAHEATHVARLIWDHLMENSTGREADAYLVGWIAGCIESVKKGKATSGKK